MKNNNPLIKNASDFVFNLFKEKLSGEHVYHNYKHTFETVKACKELSGVYNLTSREHEILLLAAWFHDTGYVNTYQGHEESSVAIMKDYLQGEYKLEDIAEIESLILSTKANADPDGTLQEILHDADYISMGKKRFNDRAELLRIEWERVLKKNYTPLEWAEEQLNFLLRTTFRTEEALTKYDDQREVNIRQQRELIDKLKAEDLKRTSKLEKNKNEPKKDGRGIETLYRSVYAYHINLSSIADNKANIMISINTIIISLVITLFGTGFTFSTDDEFSSVRFVYPMVILLLGSLTAVVFAIFSARPNVTSKEKYELSNKQSSVLFFGNFTQLQLKEFVDQINLLKNQKEELYNSMSIDIYHLGAVLMKKYRLLSWSYNVFMGGLVLSGLGFIIIMILSYE
jgi:predicted metal-dependent HD superfamily phosphohydrolase